MRGLTLRQEDAGSVFPLLLTLSGYLAMERGSELVEPCDLIKAIYIADLEHVSSFWDHWEGFERFVSNRKSAKRPAQTYVNRILYLIRLELTSRENPGCFIGFGAVSQPLRERVDAARKLAGARDGSPGSPSSQDLLFCACSHDPDLAAALQSSGLHLKRLAAAVQEPSR